MNPVNDKTASDRRLQSLGLFIELEKQLRHAENEQSLAFLLVNETHNLASYRQAMLWKAGTGNTGRLLAVSGLPNPDANAPFTVWLNAVAAELNANDEQGSNAEIRSVTKDDLSQNLAQEWHNWLPTQLLLLPLRSSDGGLVAALLLAREEAWSEGEQLLLSYYADTATHAWSALGPRKKIAISFNISKNKYWLAGVLAALLLCFYPVPQTALVPAEIIARDPVFLRAPLDGVIDQVHVEPNQVVNEGDLLLTLDDTRISSQLEVATKSQEVAESEYRQAQQQGLFDSRANASLSLLKGQVDQHAAEVKYLQDLLSRVEMRAPQAGIAVFDDVNDWIGRPVITGERIMMVADPQAARLELRVPVDDLITFEEGARVRLFLNIDPHRPVEARLAYASYQATLTPEGIIAYRVVANFEDATRPLRIGLQGTAKLYGERTVLILYLLRRPLRTIRQVIGV